MRGIADHILEYRALFSMHETMLSRHPGSVQLMPDVLPGSTTNLSSMENSLKLQSQLNHKSLHQTMTNEDQRKMTLRNWIQCAHAHLYIFKIFKVCAKKTAAACRSKVHQFGKWAAANCAKMLSANAG